MFRIPVAHLSAAEAAGLAQLQATIMRFADYAAQVEVGKKKWAVKPAPLFGRIKTRLEAMCSGNIRCIYCEDSRADEIEHMQPKDLYPQKVFVWGNYVLACGPCNGPKNNRFAIVKVGKSDLVDVTRRPGAPVVRPTTGTPALIDPRTEDPLSLLWLDMNTWRFTPRVDIPKRAGARAAYTIDVLRLNTRDELLRGRRSAFTGYLARLRDYAGQSKNWDLPRRGQFVADFRAERYRTVWLEMLRQRKHHPEVDALLSASPESRSW